MTCLSDWVNSRINVLDRASTASGVLLMIRTQLGQMRGVLKAFNYTLPPIGVEHVSFHFVWFSTEPRLWGVVLFFQFETFQNV